MPHSNLFNLISMQISKDRTFYVKNAIITKFSRKEPFRFCPKYMTETLESLEEFIINIIKEVHNEV
jgi:hypothetical protein